MRALTWVVEVVLRAGAAGNEVHRFDRISMITTDIRS